MKNSLIKNIQKWARWDLNPGSPAPQASVIIRTRLRAQTTRLTPHPKPYQIVRFQNRP